MYVQWIAGALYWSYGQNTARTTTVFTQWLPGRTRQHRQYLLYSFHRFTSNLL